MRSGDRGAVRGVVFDIQRYAIYDGPGIRTCVFLKGCPLHCGWCHNPESQRAQCEMVHDRMRCGGCGNCVRNCRHQAIILSERGIRRDPVRCTGCGDCIATCSNGAMERVGTVMTAGEVAERALEDVPFFNESHGGVTLSGGEPTVQMPFLLDILARIKEQGVHTTVETCGYFPAEAIPGLAAVTDLFLFDIKQVDPEKHEEGTGVRPEKILANFKRIVAGHGSCKILPRIPLIPDFNIDAASVSMVATFLQDAGYCGAVHILPYNSLSKHKYEKLGMADRYRDRGMLQNVQLECVRSILQQHGFEVCCNH